MEIDHPDMVRVLAKSGTAILETLTPDGCHALHMLIGMAGEQAEMLEICDLENALEELGDFEFYFEGLRQVYGITLYEVQNPSHELVTRLSRGTTTMVEGLSLAVGNCMDAVKKEVIYRKPIDLDKLREAMQETEYALGRLRVGYRVTRDQCIAANIAKLGKRYEGFKYSDSAAQNRADKG